MGMSFAHARALRPRTAGSFAASGQCCSIDIRTAVCYFSSWLSTLLQMYPSPLLLLSIFLL